MVRPGRQSVALAANQQQHKDISSLALGESISESEIVSQLSSRFLKDDVYVKAGDRGMLFMHPQRELHQLTEAASKEAAATEDPKDKQPHVFDLARAAYMNMLRMKEDQSIVLCGSSGSGKSLNSTLVTRHLLDLSKSSKKKSKTQSAILKVDRILNSFGNAWTASNRDGTCLAKYTEFQFDDAGKMVGAKYIPFFLDKSRLTDAEDNSWGNFHIFYQLLAGTTIEEKQNWGLTDSPDHFHYLTLGNVRSTTVEDGQAFSELRDNLKSLGIGRRQQTQLFQILAAILQLGNIIFFDNPKNKHREECYIKNEPQLVLVAKLLGVTSEVLESVLTVRTKLVRKDMISLLLDAEAAEEQRDALARTLYSVVVNWVVDQINEKLCRDEAEWTHFIALLDYPGFAGPEASSNDLNRLLKNYCADSIEAFVHSQIFDVKKEVFEEEGLVLPDNPALLTAELLEFLETGKDGNEGLFDIINDETLNYSKAFKIADRAHASNNPCLLNSKRTKYSFLIRHPSGVVEYDTRAFEYQNTDTVKSDFITLIRGNQEQPGTSSGFLRSLFSDKLVTVKKHQADQTTAVGATTTLTRSPSVKKTRKAKEMVDTVICQVQTSLREILECLGETRTWFAFCVRPNQDSLQTTREFEKNIVATQVQALKLAHVAQCPTMTYVISFLFPDVVDRYGAVIPEGRDPKARCQDLVRLKGWMNRDAYASNDRLFLGYNAWLDLENSLTAMQMMPSDMDQTFAHLPKEGDNDSFMSDNESHYSSEFDFDNRRSVNVPMFQSDVEKGGDKKDKDNLVSKDKKKEKKKLSPLRKKWLCCVWSTTFCFPPFCLSLCGRMKRKDRQLAWREKVTLNLVIYLLCAFILFIIAGLNLIICPNKKVISPGEASEAERRSVNKKPTVYMYGSYYVIKNVVKQHEAMGYFNSYEWEEKTLGTDVSMLFPKASKVINNWIAYCPSFSQPIGFDYCMMNQECPEQPPNWMYDHTTSRIDYLSRLRRFRVGDIVWDNEWRNNFYKAKPKGRILVAYGRIYDVSGFFKDGYNDRYLSNNQQVSDRVKTALFQATELGPNQDNEANTKIMERLKAQIGAKEFSGVKSCLDNLFQVALVDERRSPQCVVPNYILLAASIILFALIVFKFLAALQFNASKNPEEHDKFVICQVPCYTEGEPSLVRTINSIAGTSYDDKHKLLVIVADGMIIGSGNDRPTPRIVLDILGVDQNIDPPALDFQSIGEGIKQHNMGKIYSGLYEYEGHTVPYLVIVKVGKPSERARPGNRGKRDSQMVLMRFLSRVHFNQAMSPMELEMYHHMKNIIGVDPAFYEYVLMVDSDTEVYPDALNRLISRMVRDGKIMGICGETQIANQSETWVTMMQVYEYFISHHLAKAFESLFGSVTCLPGCFCLYRIRTVSKNLPLLIAPMIINDYSECNVDTLHLKNLLHLGEDRYLTTLMLKHFPNMKTKFTYDAKCKTVAPDRWNVLLSQRRRWINSTVHNLMELVLLPELCGFCCFSMRFVVFIDLFSTVVQPSALLYVGFLIFLLIYDENVTFPLISLIIIGATYGLQIIIFLLRREWDHIGWIIIYILAVPIFTFYLPIYSFWHFDDFSWGNTRRVVGEASKAKYVADVESFDPASIPLKKWSEHEAEMVEKNSNASHESYNWDSISMRSARKDGSIVPPPIEGSYAGSVYAASAAVASPKNRASFYGVQNGHRASWISNANQQALPPPISPTYRQSSFENAMPSNNSNPYASMMSYGTPVMSMMGPPAGMMMMPSDEAILEQVRRILSTADLMTVTKKQVRQELNRVFGMDLTDRKDYIHQCIDMVLQGN